MVDIELTIKSLRLAWVKKLLFRDNCNWKIVPDYFLNKHGGLNFLLRYNYDIKYSRHIPTFYRDILIAFDEIKILYNYDQGNDSILFNNKDILVNGKPLFIREWFTKGMNECIYIPHISHTVSQGALQFYLSEIGRQLWLPLSVHI